MLRLDLSNSLKNFNLKLSHDDLASFELPESALVAAKNEGESECTFVVNSVTVLCNVHYTV